LNRYAVKIPKSPMGVEHEPAYADHRSYAPTKATVW
jgi:hypothetical protein